MQIHRRRRIEFEAIAVDATESFAVREFHKTHFPFNWHYHPEVEIALVFEGRGRRYVGDSVQDYGDGDCCLLAANLPHTWQSEPVKGRGVRSMVIQFLPGCLGEALFG